MQVWTELPELITAVSFTRDGKFAIAGSFVGQCVRSLFLSQSARDCVDRSKMGM